MKKSAPTQTRTIQEPSFQEKIELQNSALKKIKTFLQKQNLKARALSLLAFTVLTATASAQTAEWTWIAGSSSVNQTGHYGTKGVAHKMNKPGARASHGSTFDDQGNFWMFGGRGLDANGNLGYLNDLWKWDGSNWTWVAGDTLRSQSSVFGSKGVANANNKPGARKDIGFWNYKDTLFLFGGQGVTPTSGNGSMNQLWKWDGTNWTWLSGTQTSLKGNYGTMGQTSSTSFPGSRHGMAGTIDNNGNIYILGGTGYGATQVSGLLSDLWKWDGTNWTWLSGSQSVNVSASYGTKNVPSSSNTPGGNMFHEAAILSNGDILLFGGISSGQRRNALWKWDGNNWTWLSGSSSADQAGVYSSSHIPNSNAVPGARHAFSLWTDKYDNLYIFGGSGKDANGNIGGLNDLWKWDGTNWYWIGGGKFRSQSSVHGTKGLFSKNNTIGSRYFQSSSTTENGSIVTTGGTKGVDRMNDVWQCNLIYKIENGGHNYEKSEQLSITSEETSGKALQDIGDIISIGNISNTFTEHTTYLPSNSNVATRIKRNWRINITDANSNGGKMEFRFHLGGLYKPLVSYYLLKRATKTDDFTVVPNTNFRVDKTDVIFTVDLDDLDDNYLYTIGRSDDFQGNALNFDAATTSDYVELPALLNPSSSSFTAETWFRVNKVNNQMILFGQLAGTGTPRNLLFLNSVGKIRSKLGNVVTSTNETIAANKWYHGAVTYDGSTVKVYLNGILVASQSATAESCDGNWLLGISSGLTLPLDGEMDEARVWNTALTDLQIRQNMHRPLRGTEANLLAYYKFDRHEGSYLSDASKNNHGGTLQNFALAGTESNWVTSSAPIADSTLSRALNGPGYGLQFDGIDDYVTISNLVDPSTSAWSIEFWFRLDTLKGQSLLHHKFGTVGSEFIGVTQRHHYLKSVVSTNIFSDDKMEVDRWYFVSLTYGNGTLKLYLDGIHQESLNVSSYSNTGDFILGANQGLTDFAKCKIDELRAWTDERTQAEIQDNMYRSLEGNETGLAHYYTFDATSGSVLADLVGSEDGTLNNFSTSTCWVSTKDREPFKTLKAGLHSSNDVWKEGIAPSSSTDRIAVFHNLTLSSTGAYNRFQVANGASVSIGADLSISGDVIINGALSGNNKIVLNGSDKQCLGGTGTIGNLQVNNANDISLEGDLILSGALTLTNGDIEINDQTLTLSGTTSHGSSSSYLKLNGTGGVKVTVSSDPVIVPVGRNPYLPIVIDDGGGAEFTVGVAEKVYDNPQTQANEQTTLVVTETWSIQASEAVDDVSVTLQWNAAQEASGFDRSTAHLSYWEEGVSSHWNAGTQTAASGSGPYTLSRTMDFTTTPYYFGVGSSGSLLPVELSSFQVEWLETDKSAQLKWSTASETNNNHFEIERSFNGLDWHTIGQKSGQGTSFSPTHYDFIDNQLPSVHHTVYYRLRQVDFNGQFEYSPIRTLSLTEQSRSQIFSLYPNPAKNRLVINTNSQIEEVAIFRLSGKQVPSGLSQSEIDVSMLPAGQYLVQVRSAYGVHQEKLIIE